MDRLLELNKTTLYTKLDKVQKIKDLYVANDLIDVLSMQKERDKRMISDYTSDEVKAYKIKRASGTKIVRMFTLAGITKYLTEGKIYDYPNACGYFGVPQINLKHIEYEEFLAGIASEDKTDGSKKKYKTSTLLKWLFGKRKMCKALSDYTTIASVLELFAEDEDVNQERIKFLQSFDA